MSKEPEPSEPDGDAEPPGTRRVFIALPLEPAVRTAIAALSGRLQKAAHFLPLRAVWVPEANFHLTLHFLADVEAPLVERLATRLATIAGRSPEFDLEFRGLGYFPHERAPSVLWAGVHRPPPQLDSLRLALNRLVGECGIPLVHAEFHPHITLARFKSAKAIEKFTTQARRWKREPLGTSRVAHVDLMESNPRAGGADYTTLVHAPLKPEAVQPAR